MNKLSEKGWARLMEVYLYNESGHFLWILPHAKPLLTRRLIEEDEATGTYYITDLGKEKLREKKLIT